MILRPMILVKCNLSSLHKDSHRRRRLSRLVRVNLRFIVLLRNMVHMVLLILATEVMKIILQTLRLLATLLLMMVKNRQGTQLTEIMRVRMTIWIIHSCLMVIPIAAILKILDLGILMI